MIVQRPRKIKMYKESLEGVLKAFRMHPDVFDHRLVNEEMISKVEAWVDTRIFGSNNLPYCALIPFADNLNHSDTWIQMNTINKDLHKLGQQAPGSYYKQRKYIIDVSMLYDENDKLSSDELANVSGRFSSVNYEANKLKFESCEGHQAFLEMHPDKAIWDVPWMVENFKDEESDDDDDEESDDQEPEEEVKTTQDFKEKMEKKCLKVDRKQSLKPFTELE